MAKDFPNRWFRLKRVLKDGTFFFDKVHGFCFMDEVFLHVHHITKVEEDVDFINLYDDESNKLIATFYQ